MLWACKDVPVVNKKVAFVRGDVRSIDGVVSQDAAMHACRALIRAVDYITPAVLQLVQNRYTIKRLCCDVPRAFPAVRRAERGAKYRVAWHCCPKKCAQRLVPWPLPCIKASSCPM